MRLNCSAVSMVVVAMLASVALAAPVEFFNVTFDDVVVPQGGFASVPISPAIPGATSTMATSVDDRTNAPTKVYEQFVDPVTGKTLGGNGNNVVILNDPLDNNYCSIRFDLAQDDRPTSGIVTISLKAIFDSAQAAATGSNDVSFILYDKNNSNLANFKFRQDLGRIVGVEYYQTGNSSATLDANATRWVVGEVLDISIVVNLDQNGASLFVNDTFFYGTLTDGSCSLDIRENAGFGGFRIQSPSTTISRIGVDDVVISYVPEPASLSFLLGGVALLLKKRA